MYPADGGLGHHTEVPGHLPLGAHSASASSGFSQIPQLTKGSGSMSSRGGTNAKSGASAGGVGVKSPTSKIGQHSDGAAPALNGGASQRRPSGENNKGELSSVFVLVPSLMLTLQIMAVGSGPWIKHS